MAKDKDQSADPPADTDKRSWSLLERAFNRRLNEHGFGFQYAMLRHIEEMGRADLKFPWAVEASEFPVSLRGHTTHVDFVLLNRHLPDLRIVAECKRANPALADWCFVRVPHVPEPKQVGIEYLVVDLSPGGLPVLGRAGINPESTWPSERVYNQGFAIRRHDETKKKNGEKKEKDDEGGGNRSALRDAIAQVQRGTSGVMEFLVRHAALVLQQTAADLQAGHSRARGRVLPVLFTNAALWTSDIALASSDVSSGKVPPGSLAKTDWLWLKHNVSPDLRHEIAPSVQGGETLGSYLVRDFSRCMAIVRPEGTEGFLRNLHQQAM